jgi:hydroxyethylthiazole kinase
MFQEILEKVQRTIPLVHCITNYVTVNDCANILLAAGASPIMADDENEVEEITSLCNALAINIGTLNGRTIESMILAGRKANELSHPTVLDPVGAGASNLRTSTTKKLIDQIHFSVIRGNISEIKTIAMGSGNTKGVDADTTDAITEETLDDVIDFSKELSARLNSVIVITGAIDIVTDGTKTYMVRNGHGVMSKITGTGCMLTAMIAGFCAANPDNIVTAAATAVTVMGISGELAYEKMRINDAGTSSFRNYLIDEVSKMNALTLKEGMKVECR